MKFNNSNMDFRVSAYNVKNKIINVQLKLCQAYRHVFLLYFVPGISTSSRFLIIVSPAPATTTKTVMASTTALDMPTLVAITSTPTSYASTCATMTSTPALDASTSTSMTSLQSSTPSMYLMSSSSAQQAGMQLSNHFYSSDLVESNGDSSRKIRIERIKKFNMVVATRIMGRRKN